MKEPLVLLVEDNPHIMDINTAALTMRGCRVLQAATVQACREQLRLHDVELIVLDILLPDGDGLTLCREIKDNYDWGRTRTSSRASPPGATTTCPSPMTSTS